MSRTDDDLRHLGRDARPACALDAPGRTWDILARPGFLRRVGELRAADPPVSAASTFMSPEWAFDAPPPCAYPTLRIGFHDIDEDLACELKMAILVAMVHPSSRRLSIESAASLGMHLTMLGRWMTHVGYASLSDLGHGFGTLFMEALAEFVAELHGGTLDVEAGDWDPRAGNAGGAKLAILGAGGRIVRGGAEQVANSLIFLHQSAAVIGRFAGASVRGAPFDKDVATQVADAYPAAADRTTQRLPDAVLRLLLPAARRMLGVPADDIRRLLPDFIAMCGDGVPPPEAARRLDGFAFGEIEPGEGPWCAGLGGMTSNYARTVRALVQQVLSAAILIVLLGTGMRPGEVLGLLGGRRGREFPGKGGADWVPRCVTETPSKSGFSVAMLLHGHVFKQRRRPWPVSWLLALRQADEGDPWVLKALLVIETVSELLRPLAPEDGRDALVLDFAGRGYDGLRVDRVHAGKLADMVRRSVPRFLDLSSLDPDAEEAGRPLRAYVASGGGCIALYQCRKTYAQTLYEISPLLVIPISRQYHHSSPEETFDSYVTNGAVFRRELETYRSLRNGRLLQEAMEGEAPAGGTMASVMDRMLAAAAPRPSPEAREAFWSRCREVGDGLFQPGRLRPSAGAANLFAATPPDGPESSDELARSGPSVLRTWVRARREVDEACAVGSPARGRAARDVAVEAARRLARMGFEVPAQQGSKSKGGA